MPKLKPIDVLLKCHFAVFALLLNVTCFLMSNRMLRQGEYSIKSGFMLVSKKFFFVVGQSNEYNL